MTALTMDMRELTHDEVDEVSGAWIANAAGAAVGAIGGGVGGYITSGGSLKAAAIGAGVGAVGGAFSPIRGAMTAATAVRQLHAVTVASAVGAGVNASS